MTIGHTESPLFQGPLELPNMHTVVVRATGGRKVTVRLEYILGSNVSGTGISTSRFGSGLGLGLKLGPAGWMQLMLGGVIPTSSVLISLSSINLSSWMG